MNTQRKYALLLALAGVLLLLAAQATALQQPARTPMSEKATRSSALEYSDSVLLVSDPAVADKASYAAALGAAAGSARVDGRSGTFATLLLSEPMIPGSGVGNTKSWAQEPKDAGMIEDAAWSAFHDWLVAHESELAIDLGELGTPRVVSSRGGAIVQIVVPHTVGGITVRGSMLNATINNGNLVLVGFHRWAAPNSLPRTATNSESQAWATVDSYLGPNSRAGTWRKAHLSAVVLAGDNGYDQRLVWVLSPRFPAERGRFEALVDARNGELLVFQDTNHYGVATPRTVEGGIYPVSNDGVAPDGVEVADSPMPWADVSTAGGDFVTDGGGNLPVCADGTITSTLDSQYVRMADDCGAISLSSTGDLDFLESGGDDCTTPGVGGAGNTHSSRTGFYELNKLIEQARSQLPDNTWLQETLQSNMNINDTCNAFWDGSTVNFYRSGGGCGNTGEIAAIFDHEWGHGMDDNDITGTIGNSGEGIADIYATLRLATSCIGRGFLDAGTCSGYGDGCTECSGIREIDWEKHNSGVPHDVTWARAFCGTGPGCTGASSHCPSHIISETVWDLYNRDLRGAPYNFDMSTALELTTRYAYVGGSAIDSWFNCSQGDGGCPGTSAYMQFLAVDDDNGNIADGTPHMTGIHAAFDRHGIACATPTVTDAGCAGGPTAAPNVTSTALSSAVRLSWGAVGGASKYEIFRTEGVFQCDFGKVKVGETTDTNFTAFGLRNGAEYSFTVWAVGSNDACTGPMSSCESVTPASGAALAGSATSLAFVASGGDDDAFVDNCESVNVTFDVANLGTTNLTNVRILDIASSQEGLLPAGGAPVALVAPCDNASLSFDFLAGSFNFGDSVSFDVQVTSDELAPAYRTLTIEISSLETDLQAFATKTYSFEADYEGWNVTSGTFDRNASQGGGDGTMALNSSNGLADQCDRAESPLIIPTATTTLSLWNNYDIEVFSASTWYDRANIALVETDGTRNLASPDGGRAYNADSAGPGNYSGCNAGEDGWAGLDDTWATSSWTAGALGSAGLAGQEVNLVVTYSTDPAESRRGFAFDGVTLTDFEQGVPDVQADCEASGIFADGFESGDTSRWSNTTP